MSQIFYKSNTSLLSAGHKFVYPIKENAISFIDISLSDVIQIESGFYSIIAVTNQGHVYGRGGNSNGELSLGDRKTRKKWTPIQCFPSKVRQISYKHNHSLFLTFDGKVYSCGTNQYGQLGIGNTTNQNVAQQILINTKSIKVLTGTNDFSFVLCEVSNCFESTSCGGTVKTSLYAFGINDHGQLGINQQEEKIIIPTKIVFFDDKPPIQDVQAGTFHSMVLLSDGSLYAMGEKSCCGQMLSIADFYSPVLVSIGNLVKSIYCSSFNDVIQTTNHEYHLIGNSTLQCPPEFPKGIQVKKLVATYCSFFLLTTDNDLYVIGKGGHGDRRINDDKDINIWTLCKTNVFDVQAGLYNSFLFIFTPFVNLKMKFFTDVYIK